MTYTTAQWLLIFFIYCFLGWVWETCYVSLKQRSWVNRGFLYGPWLPIYGFGAIIILFLTLPVRSNIILVYIFGLLGATALEYVTGAVMERIFHMRYWDYSKQPLNVGGYICLFVSLAWGVFSVLLVRVLHPPVERLVLAVPPLLAEILSLVLTVLFTTDVVRSVQAALNLKELMKRLTESNQALERINERLSPALDQLKEHMAEIEETISTRHERAVQSREERANSRKEFLLMQLEKSRDRKAQRMALLLKKTDAGLAALAKQLEKAETDAERERLSRIENTMLAVKEALHKAEIDMAARRDRDFMRAASILYRNPTASSRKYRDAFSMLKSLRKKRKGEKEADRDQK